MKTSKMYGRVRVLLHVLNTVQLLTAFKLQIRIALDGFNNDCL